MLVTPSRMVAPAAAVAGLAFAYLTSGADFIDT
jgi:hypothetical protein